METARHSGKQPVAELRSLASGVPEYGRARETRSDRGDTRKAKLLLATDSELVREGKVKRPRKGSEIAPETVCLQLRSRLVR